MNALLTDVETEMDGVQTSIVPWKNKVADRENIYTGVRPRTTQMVGTSRGLQGLCEKGRSRDVL